MATHSSVLAWRIPGTGEPGGLPSMGSHRVRHDWSDLAAAAAATTQIHLKTNKQKTKTQSLAVLSFSTFEIKVRKCLQDSWLQTGTRAYPYKSQHVGNANELPWLEIIFTAVNIALSYFVDGACWAAVYGVAHSWTRLKRLSSSSSSSSSILCSKTDTCYQFLRVISKRKKFILQQNWVEVQLGWSSDSWIILSHYLTAS